MTGKHEGRLVGGHDGEHKGKHEGKHEGEHGEEHNGEHNGETWRPFDFGRESWRENMVGSHKEEPCRLFDQAIYIYLISCRVESSFRVELSNQASQLNSSSRVQLLNSTQHFFKKIQFNLTLFKLSIRLNVISLIQAKRSWKLWFLKKRNSEYSYTEQAMTNSHRQRDFIYWIEVNWVVVIKRAENIHEEAFSLRE